MPDLLDQPEGADVAAAERPRSSTDRGPRLAGGRRRLVLAAAIVVVASALASLLFLSCGGDGGGGGGDGSSGTSRATQRSGRATSTSTSTSTSTPPPSTAPATPPPGEGPAPPGAPGPSRPEGAGRTVPGDVVLAADGLGVVRFGAPAADAVAALTAALGPPDDDTGLVDPAQEQVLGACPAGRQRAVRWGQLTVGFVEGVSSYASRATEHVVLYSYGDPEGQGPAGPLATATGVGVGSTVDEVRQAYAGAAHVVPGDEIVPPYVEVGLGGEHPLVLQTTDERVSSIRAGEPCA